MFVGAKDRSHQQERNPTKAANSTDLLRSTQQRSTAIPKAKAVASECDAEQPNSFGSAWYDCDIGPLGPPPLGEVASGLPTKGPPPWWLIQRCSALTYTSADVGQNKGLAQRLHYHQLFSRPVPCQCKKTWSSSRNLVIADVLQPARSQSLLRRRGAAALN
jgi:hypothetical protein